AGRFRIEPLKILRDPDRAVVLRNFRSTLAQLDAESPGESPLLVKPLGGNGHPGGALYDSRGNKDYANLVHFALGATNRNRPPEAIMQKRYRARVGAPTAIDGTLSGDPEGDDLTYRWSVIERPPGSRAALTPDAEGNVRLTPDRSGVYQLELAVHDGKLWSLPTRFLVVASAGAAAPMPTRRDPTDMGGKPAKPKQVFLDRRLKNTRLRLIRRLFLDLKWRTPRIDEIEQWYDRPHDEMVRAFLKDEEAWSAWYEQQLFYFLLLDRFRPKEGRLTTLAARLTRGDTDIPMALQEVVRSQYFGARNPGNDTFVTVVLEQCLGMVVQERKSKAVLDKGKKMYDGYKAKLFKRTGSSQSDFVRIVFEQPSFYEHLLGRMWKDLHGEPIDKKKLKPFVARCMADRKAVRKILQAWLTGPAYIDVDVARTKPEVPYVRGLFMDALDRTPTYDELRNVRNAFLSLADPTPIRLVMGRVLLESDQATMPASALTSPERFVREQFVRLLARQPNEREAKAFVDGLKHDPRITPRVILWTLISSPEYQTY
ncbi:MAG: hypothetical protein OER88_11000, partial [Planctomycetota bacterium]|nr:hypothetical protein [Planctomycetota bacterium]